MNKIIHRAESRGQYDYGWLKTNYSFSFSNYYNPEKIRFGLLRVLNDDTVEPGHGFDTHPHDNMEIITIPLEGVLQHADSVGNKEDITAGEVQVMSAGRGLRHSEKNPSSTEPVNLLQIWVLPKEKNIQPRYAQKRFSSDDRKDKLQLIVAPNDINGALSINQDAYFWLTEISEGKQMEYKVQQAGHGVYVFVISGSIRLDGEVLNKRDAVGISQTDAFTMEAKTNAYVLLMEVPMN